MKNKILSAVSVGFILFFLLALLNRTGSFLLFWKEEPLGSITHDSGYGYYAFVRDENISELDLPFFLLEDGMIFPQEPLSVNEDITASIKEAGGGRYQLLANNDLYLSASDNSPDDHEYSIISPLIIRNRYLLAVAFLAAAAAAVDLFLCLKEKNYTILKNILRSLAAAFCLMLLLPWTNLIFRDGPIRIGAVFFKPILQRNIAFIGLLFLLMVGSQALSGKNRLLSGLAVLVVLINTVWYFVPEWNWYGLRADSPAYLQKYSASSIRTPGYPAFIESVYRLTGNQDLAALRTETETVEDESLQNAQTTNSYGLIDVTRAQKCVLGAAFLILFFVFCRYYSPVWFAFISQIILCGGFLGVDNSYIMTECLSQAMILIAIALLFVTVKEKSARSYFLLCVICAAAIMIRPANIFLGLPLLVCFIFLVHEKRSILLPGIGCLVFIGLAAIPAITIYRQYGIFVWMPSSGYVEIARAVEIMQPGDENAFADPELRDFCRDLLALKQQYPDADQNTNMWQVGIAAAEARGYDLITCSPLFGKVSRKIFMIHFRDFASSLLSTIQIGLDRSRLQIGPLPFWVILLVFTVLFAIRITADSLLGMFLAALHVIHLCMSMINQPERRYIYSTEILCLLGWLLIVINLFNSKSKKNQ